MSAELVDVRCKITDKADAVIEARSRASGRERSEIIREVLDRWADGEIHEASVLAGLLRSKGLTGIAGGIEGIRGESQGFVGNISKGRP